jgi:predicted RNA-binding protein Jag
MSSTNMEPSIQTHIDFLLHLLLDQIVTLKPSEYLKENNQYRIILECNDNDLLIENNGELIKSVQHIIRVLVHAKFPEDRTHFFLDVGNYRKNREKVISIRIPELAEDEVIGKGRTIIIMNMTGYERMQVHHILADVKGLETTSVGEPNSRKLMILPTSDVGAAADDDSLVFDINLVSKEKFEDRPRPRILQQQSFKEEKEVLPTEAMMDDSDDKFDY